MKLCSDCAHSEFENSKYRVCKAPSVIDHKKKTNQGVICMNVREKGNCGPDGKLWKRK